MSYKRKWTDRRNAVAFTAECARLALPFYRGGRKPDLVAAIELVERYANGEEVDIAAIDNTRCLIVTIGNAILPAVRAGADSTIADAVYTVLNATRTATDAIDDTIALSVPVPFSSAFPAFCASCASRAGVDEHEIQAAFARWVVRDLSCGREPPVLLRQAAGAAVVAGDEELAREILA